MKRGKKANGEGAEFDALLPSMGEYLKEHGRREVAIDPVKQLRQRAKAGDVEAQYELGAGMIPAGKWDEAGEKWLRKAARKGHLESKRLIVRHLNWGTWGCCNKQVERWTRDLAELGDAQAEFVNAIFQRTTELRLYWLERSVAQSYAPAMVEMGYNYANGWSGKQQDMCRAVELFRRAAAQENDEALCLLGMIYAEGRGVVTDAAEALRWIEKPLQKGLGQAWLTRGRIHEACGDAEGYRKAMDCYRRATDPYQWRPVWPWLEPVPNCRLHGEAAYHVGRLYHDGIGVERDVCEAAQWYAVAAKEAQRQRYPNIRFDTMLDAMHAVQTDLNACRKAARSGNVDAEAEMGLRLFNPHRDGKESVEGEQWIERSARRGHPLGQYAWGCLLEYHRGNPNADEVASWYRQSAEQGLPEAQAEMGRYCLGGEYWQEWSAMLKQPNGEWDESAKWSLGVFIVRQPDFRQAAEWLRLAAEQGVMHAQFELGDLYVRGQGVKQNYSAAAAWRRRAIEWTYGAWTLSVRTRFAGRWMNS